jgi:undecaprenyl-phosphate galactose phosphotransferase
VAAAGVVGQDIEREVIMEDSIVATTHSILGVNVERLKATDQLYLRLNMKRAVDLILACVLLVAILPAFSLIVLTIVLHGQSPFYSHKRVGWRGREFGCLKFRTMCRNADAVLEQLLQRDPAAKTEWETNRKLRRDPRVTYIGKLLRATSMDELPQLLNVLVGDMSLVGPRPVTRDELTAFYRGAAAACYKSVRPGITGLWQICGRSKVGYNNRVALDVAYTEGLSLKADMIILFRTIGVVFKQQGAW